MNPKKLVLAFTPLLLFSVVGHLVGPLMVGWVALASSALALVLLLTDLREGVKLITAASIVVFAGLGAVALLGGDPGRTLVEVYGTAICALLIGGLMLISVATVPFTEQYARAQVPRQYWTSPTFHAVNRRISTAWAGAVIGIGASRLTYGLIATASERQTGAAIRLILDWGIPILLVITALKATKRIAATADQTPPTTSTPVTPTGQSQ